MQSQHAAHSSHSPASPNASNDCVHHHNVSNHSGLDTAQSGLSGMGKEGLYCTALSSSSVKTEHMDDNGLGGDCGDNSESGAVFSLGHVTVGMR